jgi:hypothetical protein
VRTFAAVPHVGVGAGLAVGAGVGVGVGVSTDVGEAVAAGAEVGVGAGVSTGVGDTVVAELDVGAEVAVGLGVGDVATMRADSTVNPADALTDPLEFLLPFPVDVVGADVAPTRWVPTLAPAGTENFVLNVPLPLACTTGMPV